MHAWTPSRSTIALTIGGLLLVGLASVPPAHAESAATRVLVQVSPGSSVAGAAAGAAELGGTVTSVFGLVDAFAATVPAEALDALRALPGVVAVEPDGPVTPAGTAQTDAPWNLDRVDQRPLPLSGSYSYDTTGAGVDVYVVDSGVYAEHPEFGGRVADGETFVPGEPATDLAGHGTHVAGTIAAMTWGAAKGARIIPVKVLDANFSGYVADLIGGIHWVIQNRRFGVPAVMNLSLSASPSALLDSMIEEATAAGITVVVAAGNAGEDACSTSPAAAPAAITVGATDQTDARASFSNYGPCVDLFAPGVGVTSTWLSSSTDNARTSTQSGTSVAAPLVAGLAARYLQAHPTATPAQVQAALKAGATQGVVADARSAAGLVHVGPPATVSSLRAPIDPAPIRNTAQAGRAIPFAFTVTDPTGAPIAGLTTADVAVVSALTATCTSARTDAIEAYTTSSAGQLLDLGGGSYQYNVKTPKEWAGLCGPVGVSVLGTARTADFAFRS